MRAPAAEVKNKMVLAMSSGEISVRSDEMAVSPSRTAASLWPVLAASAAITRSMRSPLTEPGQMQFTRTLSGPSSWASVRVRPRMAHLAAA